MQGLRAMPAFDTHKAVKALTSAGFDDGQAEAVVDQINGALTENLATKADLDRQERSLRETISGLATKEELREAIAPLATKEELSHFATKEELRQELREAIAPLATKEELSHFATKEELAQLELRINAKFEQLTGRLLRYLGGGVALIVALIKGLDLLLG